ncbi:MAG: hypothetical protein KIT68_04875 [Phycisphaeraceae bacterium]|nr:hypothetical protein [Phycisphaeraceae bacterium]
MPDPGAPPACPAIGDRCPACGHPLRLIRVHAHDQCARCGINLEPCCQPQAWPAAPAHPAPAGPR